MSAVIFLGPSLPIEEARTILDATYLPPAKQGDLLSAAVNRTPRAIGLIDGLFQQSLSVWHKEILYAIQRGVRVYGASSMGALRAAETAAFGMIGIGEIFESYASGELMDDDEVALVHGPADAGYINFSIPMVNLRATLQEAHLAGVIDRQLHQQLIAISKALHFTERTVPEVLERAASMGVSPQSLQDVEQYVDNHYVDLKARDARLMLETMRDELAAPASDEPAFEFSRTSHFDTLYNRDRTVQHGNVDTPLESIGNYVALHHPEFDDLNFNALNRVLVANWAKILELSVSAAEIDDEVERFRTRWNLDTDNELSTWLAENNLSPDELRALMEDVALCRRLQRWLLSARWMDRSTKPILDELRLHNAYLPWARKAAAQERLIDVESELNGFVGTGRHSLDELITEHEEWTDVRLGRDIARWIEEAGFHSEANLKMELLRARQARQAMLKLIAQAAGSDDGVVPSVPGP